MNISNLVESPIYLDVSKPKGPVFKMGLKET